MHKSTAGIDRSGRSKSLVSAPTAQESKLVDTSMYASAQVNLRERGINKDQAQDLRDRLNSITEDWNCAEMNVYDEL